MSTPYASLPNMSLPAVRREAIVRPLGLVTQPNKMGQYPAGALKSAIDCFMRQPGVLEQSRIRFDFQASGQGGSAPQISAQLIPSDILMLQLFNAAGVAYWEWFDAVSFNAGAMTGLAWPVDGTCTWTRSRDRYIANAVQGLQTFDYSSPTTTAQRTPRFTGLPAPSLEAYVGGFSGSAVTALMHCTVTAIIRRIYPDGYELVSAVAFPSDSGTPDPANGPAADIQIIMAWANIPDRPVLAGDVIEVYRTRVQANPNMNGIGATSCDATYYLTTTHVITSGEAASSFAQFSDSIPDTGFGQELYSNPGVGGAFATRISPPLAKVLATFKGYSFAFNITEAAQIVLSLLGGIGTTDTTNVTGSDAWRTTLTGARAFVSPVTITAGSPVISGVSASDMLGVRVGQLVFSGFFLPSPPYATVIAVGTSTITISRNASGSGTTLSGWLFDVIRINGTDYSYLGLTGLPDQETLNLYLALTNSNVTLQAASLAFFSSTHANSPTATVFSISTIRAGEAPTSFTISATNGQNYQPALPEYTATPKTISPVVSTNGYAWTEEQRPDAWSVANRGKIGSSDIVAAATTHGAMWIFTLRNGLWRLSGDGGAVGTEGFDWQIEPVDSTMSLSGPQAFCVLRDTVYAYTNRGLVAISDENGIDDSLSQGVINDILPGPFYSVNNLIQVRADEENDEIWVYDGIGNAYVWSYLAKAWVQNTQLAPTPSGTYATAFWQQIKSMVIVDDTAQRARYFNPAYDNFVQCSWDYQPLYFEDPFATKQWVDTTWVFTDEFADKFIPYVQTIVRFNGQSYFGNVAPASNGADARVTYMVPRNSPAIAQAICPGILVFGSLSNTPMRFEGLSMRATIISAQQTRRNT